MQLRFNNSVPGDTHRWINVFNPSRIHYSFLEHDVFSGPRSLTQESFIDLITYMVDFGYLLSAERYLTWDNMRDLLRFVREGRERLIASTYLSDSADRAAREITPPHNPPATEADHAIALRKYGYPLPTETLLDYFRPPPQLRPMIRSSTQTPGWPSVSSIAQWGGRMLAETPTMVRNVFRTAGGTTTSLPQSLYHDWTPRKSSSLLSSLGTPLQPGNAHSLPPPNVNYSPLDHHEVQAFVRKEVDAMKNTYEAKLQMLERTHANEFENLKSEHARQLAEEKYQTEKDRRDAHADRERERQHQKNQHEHEVQALTRMHKLTVVDMKAEKERLERKYRELGEECENTEEVLAWQERDISLMLRESDDDFKFYKELIEQGKLRNADLITQEKLRHSVEMRKVHQGYKARIAESQGLAGKLFVAFLFVLLLLAAVLAEYIRM